MCSWTLWVLSVLFPLSLCLYWCVILQECLYKYCMLQILVRIELTSHPSSSSSGSEIVLRTHAQNEQAKLQKHIGTRCKLRRTFQIGCPLSVKIGWPPFVSPSSNFPVPTFSYERTLGAISPSMNFKVMHSPCKIPGATCTVMKWIYAVGPLADSSWLIQLPSHLHPPVLLLSSSNARLTWPVPSSSRLPSNSTKKI